VSSQGDRPGHDRAAGRHAAEQRPLTSVRTRQEHIAYVAGKYTDSPLTTLGHHMDMLWMQEAFSRLKRDKAPGVDGVTVNEYAENLEANLAELLELAKSGRYRTPPVRRAYIPKNEKETRPIGIPTVADKVLQRAVAMLLGPIYETDFLDCSYGFRLRRSSHQGLDALREVLKEMKGGWVLDVDIRKYFDSIPHSQLQEILRHRVKDSVILRLLAKWLRAGVLEDGVLTVNDDGTPQGGVISPLLSNIYLHTVLDVWFEQEVCPRLQGKAKLIRFADDFVIVFKHQADAQRVLEVLPKRFGKYGLTIHPDKTCLVDFRHPWDSKKKPETFDFLGFTHYWSKTRKGGFCIRKKTASQKLRRSLKGIHVWCKEHRHKPLAWQRQRICQKLQGHYAYYGVSGNHASIAAFRHHALLIWRYWLNRRSRKRDGMSWQRFYTLLQNPKFYVPVARIVHKWQRHTQLCLDF
jgi:RNA-directed DNA polymerase